MSALFLRRAFAEPSALATLDLGQLPNFEQWLRRLYLLEQRHAHGQPDHLLKAYRDLRLREKDTGVTAGFGTLARRVLEQLADRYLERCAGRVVVRTAEFQDWHQMITHLSPLAIQVAFLVGEGRGQKDPTALIDWLHAEIGETALLAPADPTLELLIETEGLHELHMHLNGSTEADIVWQDALLRPERYAKNLVKGQSKDIVADLYEGIETGFDSHRLVGRLRAARRLRYMLAENLAAVDAGAADALTLRRVLVAARTDVSDRQLEKTNLGPSTSTRLAGLHPCRILTPWAADDTSPIVLEAAFLFRIIAALRDSKLGEASGLALFHALSVQQQLIALTVQQLSQYGFDQFQKFTKTEMRNNLENEDYAPRFRQLMLHPPFLLIRHLEGRFAPKNTEQKNKELISKIIRGAMEFRGRKALGQDADILRTPAPRSLTGGGGGRIGRQDFELTLVAHFIKEEDASDPSSGLFRGRRKELFKQAQALAMSWNTSPAIRDLLRGVDAAANELHNPPEIFAPTFRTMRRTGIPHATFHVGEDFRHLIGGLRAVYEAITFLELGKGDRIGHATAAGISPWLWQERSGQRVVMTARDRLDDMIFAWSLLRNSAEHIASTQDLASRIAQASVEIFDREISAPLLHSAWRMRRLDLLEILEPGRFESPEWGNFELWRQRALANIGHLAESCTGTSIVEERRLIRDALRDTPSAFALHLETLKRWEEGRGKETCEVEVNLLSPEALLSLQDMVLREFVNRGMAIETLPTSNLRISYYNAFHEHHLFRWLGVEPNARLSVRPSVVVGTDDTGIFATNLKIEFALIADTLRRHFHLPEREVETHLLRLNRTAAAFRFRPGR